MDYSETDVCQRLGVSAQLLHTLAKEITRDGNIQKKGRAWRYTEAGVESIAVIIAKTASEKQIAPGGPQTPPTPNNTAPESVPAPTEKSAPPATSTVLNVTASLPAPKGTLAISVTVWRSREQGIVNDRIVIAYLPKTDPMDPENHITVRVRNNANYIRGMLFTARMTEMNQGEAWDERTNSAAPAPRSRGRL